MNACGFNFRLAFSFMSFGEDKCIHLLPFVMKVPCLETLVTFQPPLWYNWHIWSKVILVDSSILGLAYSCLERLCRLGCCSNGTATFFRRMYFRWDIFSTDIFQTDVFLDGTQFRWTLFRHKTKVYTFQTLAIWIIGAIFGEIFVCYKLIADQNIN